MTLLNNFLKLLQRTFLCNSFTCHLLRTCLFFKLPERIYRHLYFNGKFFVNVSWGRDFWLWHPASCIENSIFWRSLERSWEGTSIDIWRRLSERSFEVLDIGANTGIYAIAAKAQNTLARVHAFEPHPFYQRTLRKNCELNSFDIVRHEFALGETSHQGEIDDFTGGAEKLQTYTCKLDDLIDEGVIGKVDLIKMDVEGGEASILRGFKKYIAILKPAMIIEVLNQEAADEVDALISYLPYLKFNIEEGGHITLQDRVYKSVGYNILLCSREEAIALHLI